MFKNPCSRNSQRKLRQQRFLPPEKFERDTYPENDLAYYKGEVSVQYTHTHTLYYIWEWYYIYPKFKTDLKEHIKILLRREMGERLDCK